MFQNMGIWDWLIILLLLLLLFGGARLPELARSIGKSLSSFKKGVKEGEDELRRSLEDKNDSDKD